MLGLPVAAHYYSEIDADALEVTGAHSSGVDYPLGPVEDISE